MEGGGEIVIDNDGVTVDEEELGAGEEDYMSMPLVDEEAMIDYVYEDMSMSL